MAKETIRKLEAARRQLRTAIRLWFNDGDTVSIHTLAFAAYEIIHAISEKRDPNRRDLLFDTALVKDEYRRDWNRHVRKHANFFKHADKDGDAVIEFNPEFADWFIFFAIAGRELCGEPANDEESIFMWWLQIHKPHILTDQGRKMISDRVPVNDIEHLRTLSKHEFFEVWTEARRRSDSTREGLARRQALRLP